MHRARLMFSPIAMMAQVLAAATMMASLRDVTPLGPPEGPKRRFNKTSGRQGGSQFDGQRGRRGARRKWIGGQKLLWRH